MPFMQIGMLIVPAGLFMYGWTAQTQTHFILPLIGAAIFAFCDGEKFEHVEVYQHPNFLSSLMGVEQTL